MDKKNLVQFQMAIDKVEVRADSGKIIIEWYASTPDIDSHNSIIDTEAIAGWMDRYMKNPVILLWHDMDKPIGQMVSHNIDLTGLRIKAEISQDTDWIMKAIKDGVVKGFSMGFYALEWSYQTKQGVPLSALSETEIDNLSYDEIVRKITKIELLEISVVSLPSNPNTLFTLTRAIKQFFDGYEKRFAVKHIREVVENEEEILGDEVVEPAEKDIANENDKDNDIESEAKLETVEEAIIADAVADEVITEEQAEAETVDWESETIQGDGAEATGENPEPQTDGNDPKSEVENTEQTAEELKAKVVELEAQVEAKEIVANQAMEAVDKMQALLTKKTDEAVRLKAILDKIPTKKGFVGNHISPAYKNDPLANELAEAKARA